MAGPYPQVNAEMTGSWAAQLAIGSMTFGKFRKDQYLSLLAQTTQLHLMTVGRVQVLYHEKEESKALARRPKPLFLLDLWILSSVGRNIYVMRCLREYFHFVAISYLTQYRARTGLEKAALKHCIFRLDALPIESR